MPSVFLHNRNKKRSCCYPILDRILNFLSIIIIIIPIHTIAASPDELAGELDVIYKDDFDNHIHLENDYFLRDDNGMDWYQLQFDRTPPEHLRSGQRIKAKGQLKGRKF